MQARPRQAVLVSDRQQRVLALPDHRSFFPVLDAPALPGLFTQGAIIQQRLDTACRSAAAGQTRHGTAPTTPMTVVRPCHDPWRLQPTREASGHLRDVVLPPRCYLVQELRFAAVAGVERQP